MMLIRAEVYCHGWPDGNIPHGHVDIRVQGSSELSGWNNALDVILGQFSRGGFDEIQFVSFELIEERSDEFDRKQAFATVVGGEGEALNYNPVGKIFAP